MQQVNKKYVSSKKENLSAVSILHILIKTLGLFILLFFAGTFILLSIYGTATSIADSNIKLEIILISIFSLVVVSGLVWIGSKRKRKSIIYFAITIGVLTVFLVGNSWGYTKNLYNQTLNQINFLWLQGKN